MEETLLCVVCERKSNVLINLENCQHILCGKCAEKMQLRDHINDKIWKIKCPICNTMTKTQNISNIFENSLLENEYYKKTYKKNKNKDISPYEKIVEKLDRSQSFISGNDIKQKASKMQMKFQHFLKGSSLDSRKKNSSKNDLSQKIENGKNTSTFSYLISQGEEEIKKLKHFKEEIMEVNPLKCDIHNDFVSLFCVKDKEILCANCVFNGSEKHRGHTIIPLKSANEIIIKENEKFKKIVKDKFGKLEESIENCQKNIEIIEKNFLNLNLEIEKEFEDIKLLIEKKKQTAYENLNRIFSEKIFNYNNKINDLNYLKKCLSDYKYYHIDEKWDQNTFVYIYNINSLIKKTLNNIDLHLKILTKNDFEKPYFDNKNKIRKEIQKFGEILKRTKEIDEKINNYELNMEKTGEESEEDIPNIIRKSETERRPSGRKDLYIKPTEFLIHNELLSHFKGKLKKNLDK